ncbi:MAG: LuxR C-terminal-related transcriptional regulator [Blastocatellia bacterium]|nr:LuxR C-terminal-related transcriptional regulator [Blastocatellia bacterium]
MHFRELKELVESTGDAAFAVDGAGSVVVWNLAAENLFGMSAQVALGQPCEEILQGGDECGSFCSADCTVQKAVHSRQKVGNFDLQLQTSNGRKWCNISVLTAELAHSSIPYSVHIVRMIDTRKKLEMVVRDFIVREIALPPEEVQTIVSVTRSPDRVVELTRRELEILRALAKGNTTGQIALLFHISRTTVNNHIQHILQKFNAHNRLEAIHRAELAGLL